MSDKPLPTPPYSLVDENQTQGGPSRRPSYTSTQTDSYLRKADEEAELAYDDLLSNAHFEKSTGKLKLDIDGKDVHDLAESAGLKEAEGVYGDSDEDFTSSIAAQQPRVPRLNILILIVGSRGDVQPYIALGMRLAEDGHRVRLGTHKEFRDFVREASSRKVEFFDIGGDPRELMAYMVKNPGLIPGWKSLKSGDVGKNTKMLKEILAGTFRACVFPDLETQIPFSANAIIANPPCFGHIHVAEALGIPLHMSFTMPWSPTTAFPHPLVDLQFKTKGKGKDKDVSEEPSPQTSNYVSYALADHLTWLGLQRVINKFRCKTLGLPALSSHSGTGVIHRLKIPYTYCWSPALIPKPKDWKSNIDISGFYFLDLSTEYTPPPDLAKFLASGPAPIYIGFGSVPVKDPVKMSQILLEAVRKAGVRVLISAGWAGLGGAESSDDVFLLGNVPHDWLFKHVSAVCHHGGAGTTAIGLANGRPSIIVPFFGDQVFWGNMVHRAGAGPEPIPADRLNVENLTMAIQQALSKETLTAAGRMGEIIRSEDGVQRGVDSFYHKLPLDRMHCEVRPDLVAEWYYESLDIRLSAFAAATLIKSGRLKSSSLEPLRSAEYRTSRQAYDPMTGTVDATIDIAQDLGEGLVNMVTNPKKGSASIGAFPFIGASKILDGWTTGLHNLPRAYGYDVRQKGKIKDAQSGFAEGGKQFAYGFYDGITGLVTTPMKAAQNARSLGTSESSAVAKGVAQGLMNVWSLPFAGIFSLVSDSMKGIVASLSDTGSNLTQVEATKLYHGGKAWESASQAEKDVIVDEFDRICEEKKLIRGSMGKRIWDSLNRTHQVADHIH